MKFSHLTMICLYASLIGINVDQGVQAHGTSMCKMWRDGGDEWWGSQATYCCKDCCLITLSSQADCDNDKCKKCPKEDKGQCYNDISSDGNNMVTFGCDEKNQFCKYEDEDSSHELAGNHHCVNKLVNNATCDNDYQCHSGHCLIRQKRNFCYGCIAGNVPNSTDTYQVELTSYCNRTTEWCQNEDYSCKAKKDNGESCNDNNHTCKSHRCSKRHKACVACLDDGHCKDGMVCNETGHCQVPEPPKPVEPEKKDAGEKCQNHTECIDDHTCQKGRCQGWRDMGIPCESHYHCQSSFCHTETKLCDDPTKRPEPVKSSSALFMIIAIITTVLFVIMLSLFMYRCYRKRKSMKKIPLKSTKELAEELFSPEGSPKQSGITLAPNDNDEDIGSGTLVSSSSSISVKGSFAGRRQEKLNEAPSLFENEEESGPDDKRHYLAPVQTSLNETAQSFDTALDVDQQNKSLLNV